MNPWFSNPARIAALREAARGWIGTPFMPNMAARGRGASCQKFAAALLRDAGFPIGEVPDAPMSQARFSRESLVQPWMDACPLFCRIPDPRNGPLGIGDVAGFKLGGCIHHLGVVFGPDEFIHCLDPIGVQVSRLSDPTWRRRLAAAWRPIEMTP